MRREETGKAVFAQPAPEDFPVRCEDPIPGEDRSYVLYGSGGCSLYDAAELRALGGVDEIYDPAYVEDLDLGYRAWQRGWPTVFVAGAVVEHRHRATTSRYYTAAQLDAILEINYLRFLARAVSGSAGIPAPVAAGAATGCGCARAAAMRRRWRDRVRAGRRADPAPRCSALTPANRFLALTGGRSRCFPGRAPTGRPRRPGGEPLPAVPAVARRRRPHV